jgi:hypothetical protein
MIYFYEGIKRDIINSLNMSYLSFLIINFYVSYGYEDSNLYINIILSQYK